MTTPGSFISADDLRRATFVRHVEFHDELDSTNNRAVELARDTRIEFPALIVARHQTAGRGRGMKPWWSAEGALTFSVLLEPSAHGIATADWPRLSLATAVALCDALQAESRELGARSEGNKLTPCSLFPPPCSIKWPNDVLIGGRKIAGILIESPGGAAPAKDRLVMGVGLNVNNSIQSTSTATCGLSSIDFPLLHATALCDITGHVHDLQQVLTDALHAIEQRIAQLATNDPQLPTAWQRLCCLTDQTIAVTNDGRETIGRCLGIATDGALLLQTDSKIERLYSGSVTVL